MTSGELKIGGGSNGALYAAQPDSSGATQT